MTDGNVNSKMNFFLASSQMRTVFSANFGILPPPTMFMSVGWKEKNINDSHATDDVTCDVTP